MPWVNDDKKGAACKAARALLARPCRPLSRPSRPHGCVGVFPRASACGLSPGLGSAGPLGRATATSGTKVSAYREGACAVGRRRGDRPHSQHVSDWVSRLTAPLPPFDGQAGVGVRFLSTAARSDCADRFSEDVERYQGRSKWGSGVICRSGGLR
jgi:hypothetical protein